MIESKNEGGSQRQWGDSLQISTDLPRSSYNNAVIITIKCQLNTAWSMKEKPVLKREMEGKWMEYFCQHIIAIHSRILGQFHALILNIKWNWPVGATCHDLARVTGCLTLGVWIDSEKQKNVHYIKTSFFPDTEAPSHNLRNSTL